MMGKRSELQTHFITWVSSLTDSSTSLSMSTLSSIVVSRQPISWRLQLVGRQRRGILYCCTRASSSLFSTTLCLWSTSVRTSWANWNECKTRVSLLGALGQLQSMSSNICLEFPPSRHDRNLHKLPSRARLSKRADTAFVRSFPKSSLLYRLLSKIHQLCLTSDRGIGRLNFSTDWGGSLGLICLICYFWTEWHSLSLQSQLSSSISIGIAGSSLLEQTILLSPNFFLTSTVVLTLSL